MSDRLFNPSGTYSDEASAPHIRGQRMQDHRGLEFMFVSAAAAITANRTCEIHERYRSQHIRTGTGGDVGDRVGVAFTSIPDEHLGWLCIYGQGNVFVRSTVSEGNQAYTSASAGQLDDSSSGQEKILTMGFTAGRTNGGLVAAIWSYPTID